MDNIGINYNASQNDIWMKRGSMRFKIWKKYIIII